MIQRLMIDDTEHMQHTGIRNASSNDVDKRDAMFNEARFRMSRTGVGIQANSHSAFAHGGTINGQSSNSTNGSQNMFLEAKARMFG